MEKLNKRIMSGLLATSMTFGVLPALSSKAEATNNDVTVITEADAANMDLVEICHMKGIYNVIVNNVPVYVYLNNKLDNDFLLKNDAIELAKKNYNVGKVYFHSKVVESPYYVKGVTPENERYNFVYALSDKSSVSGWTRVYDTSVINDDSLVSSTIELGEFILKEEDLSRYTWDMSGFGFVDVNHDNVRNELVYLGNGSYNDILDKNSAVAMINSSKGSLSVYEKTVKAGTMRTLSSVNLGSGWKKVSINNVPSTSQIGTNPEFMEAMYDILTTTVSTEQLYFPKVDNGINQVIDSVLPNSINMLTKDEAINWAISVYPTPGQFCILKREYINRNTGLPSTVYAISTQMNVEGYDFAYNDAIASNAMICLSIQDAENYVVSYGKSATKVLR